MSGVTDTGEVGKEPLTCVPFSALIGSGFWQKFSDILLNKVGLGRERIPIHGYYTRSVAPALFSVEHSSFNKVPQKDKETVTTSGVIANANTVEEFRDMDKNELIRTEGQKLLELLSTDSGIEEISKNPSLLVPFFVLVYANLKNYFYKYWFAYPAISSVKLFKELGNDISIVSTQFDLDLKEDIILSGFFIVNISNGNVTVRELASDANNPGDYYAFFDTASAEDNPCWVLRNYVVYLIRKNKLECGALLEVLGLRIVKSKPQLKTYRFRVEFPEDYLKNPKFLGWERNRHGKLMPQSADLKSSMDPASLCESSVDFNLKLMKWRLFPSFDLERVQQTKCLLLGAGTLGCNVARCLMGWGFKNIKFLDNSTVNYSNPVRQSLFTFNDCVTNKSKAIAAAEALKNIYAGVNSSGERVTVPMPGHPVSPATYDQVVQDFQNLERCVAESDVLFLLLDTREARWLPSVMGAAENKIIINAALGFDSYLVMRHGNTENNLGCYFCTDVVAPGDSTADRTMDQQCTVTRPGVSYIASALAVELLVTMLHDGVDNPLGKPPHSIRGFLSSGENIRPTFASFDKCTACSSVIIEAYKERKLSFVLDALNDSKYLEQLSGLDKMKESEALEEILEFDDDAFDD